MPEVRDEPARSRYEITVDGAPAGYAAYTDANRLRVFTHTEVDPEFAGQGVGSALVRGALADVRARGLQLVAACPIVRAYLARHPDAADLVAGPSRPAT